MTTTTQAARRVHRSRASRSLTGPALILGGLAFFVGGVTHPGDSGAGTKLQQLHEMLVNPAWYPSHALLLAAMALFAVAVTSLRRRSDLELAMTRVLRVVTVIAWIATASMAVHLFAAVGADSIAGGDPSLLSRVQSVNETLVDASWGLAMAALAVAGGMTRTLGNRITIVAGLIGGLAFALASATIAYTDTFDPLFKVGSLLSVWAVVVGVMVVARTPAR